MWSSDRNAEVKNSSEHFLHFAAEQYVWVAHSIIEWGSGTTFWLIEESIGYNKCFLCESIKAGGCNLNLTSRMLPWFWAIFNISIYPSTLFVSFKMPKKDSQVILLTLNK